MSGQLGSNDGSDINGGGCMVAWVQLHGHYMRVWRTISNELGVSVCGRHQQTTLLALTAPTCYRSLTHHHTQMQCWSVLPPDGFSRGRQQHPLLRWPRWDHSIVTMSCDASQIEGFEWGVLSALEWGLVTSRVLLLRVRSVVTSKVLLLRVRSCCYE